MTTSSPAAAAEQSTNGPLRRRAAALGGGAGVVAWLLMRAFWHVGAGPGQASWAAPAVAVLQVTAWGVLVGVAMTATSDVARALTRRPWVRRWAPRTVAAGVLAVAGWLHRWPYGGAGLADTYLQTAPGGAVWPPAQVTPLQWQAWTAAWVIADLTAIVLVAGRVRRTLLGAGPEAQPAGAGAARQRAAEGPVTDRPAVAAAALATAVLALLVGALSTLTGEQAASTATALSWAVARVLPFGVAACVSVAATLGRVRPSLVAATLLAVVLDGCAGALSVGVGWVNPRRFVAGDEGALGWATAGGVAIDALLTALACALLATLPQTTRAVRALADRPRACLIVLLVANTVDAVATAVGLTTGLAVEANPLVAAVGVPVKWLAVTGLGVLLHRVRPHLVWPVAVAYLLVVAYHLVGAALAV